MLCSDLNGKEIKKREDISKHIADSLCCTAEIQQKSPYSNKNKKQNKKKN